MQTKLAAQVLATWFAGACWGAGVAGWVRAWFGIGWLCVLVVGFGVAAGVAAVMVRQEES